MDWQCILPSQAKRSLSAMRLSMLEVNHQIRLVSLRSLHGAEHSPRVVYREGGDGAHSGLRLTPDLVSNSEGEPVMN